MKIILSILLLHALAANVFAQNTGINTNSPQATLDVNGDLALRAGQLALPAGNSNNIDLSVNRFSFYNITGAGTKTLTGFAGGKDGRMVTLFNNSGVTFTITNNDAASAVANRVWLSAGNEMQVLKNESLTLVYNASLSKWIIAGSTLAGDWKVTGNAGTDPDTKFIGTTDNQPLMFRINNLPAGAIQPGNTFLGQAAGAVNSGANNNTAVGNSALSLNTNGNYNSAIGSYALTSNTLGNYNTAMGVSALYVNQTGNYNSAFGTFGLSQNKGSYNTAVGYKSLENNGVGEDNTATGFHALRLNLVGSQNSAFGSYALSFNNGEQNTAMGVSALENSTLTYLNTATGFSSLSKNKIGSNNTATGGYALYNNNGHQNTGIGVSALSANTDGDNNTALGGFSVYKSTTGDNNVGIGYNALYNNITGNNNTAIGRGADVNFPGINNVTVIGYNATANNANSMVFGNGNVLAWAFGRTAVGSGAALQVGTNSTNGNGAWLSSGGAWTNGSDATKKDDITKLNGPDILGKLKQLPVTRWKYKGTDEYHIGPMAQDFYRLFNVGLNNTSISSIDPAGIALKAIQEQQQIIETQNKRIEMLERNMELLLKK